MALYLNPASMYYLSLRHISVLGTPSVKGGTISVPYTAQVGGIYAETLDVTMYDANGKAVNKQSITAEGESGVAEFTPAASGTYSLSLIHI